MAKSASLFHPVLQGDWVSTVSTSDGICKEKKVLLGATYPTTTGEREAEATARIFQEFPDIQAWRVYYQTGEGVLNWDDPEIQAIPENVEIVVSYKDWDLDGEIEAYRNIPEERKGRLRTAYRHEPEQWKSPTDTGGDLEPNLWRSRQYERLNRLEQENLLAVANPGVIYTEFAARKDATKPTSEQTWYPWFGVVANDPRIRWVGFDVFDIGYTYNRPAEDMFAFPTWFTTQALDQVKELIFAEWGQVRKGGTTDDGTTVTQFIRQHFDYGMQQVNCRAMLWYWNHNNTLSGPDGILRQQEYYLFGDMLDEAVQSEVQEQPNVDDPQYRFGYRQGWTDGRVAALNDVAAQVNPFIDWLNSQRGM
jgi:hypothetical protein